MVAIPPPPRRFTDLKDRPWYDCHLPVWCRPYARLMRLDRPIGTWLLLLPCWWGVGLADAKVPDFWLMTAFAIGAIVMRGAGCVINDLYDRKLDAQVERTRQRPLASGQVKPWSAILFLGLLLLIGLRILLLFNQVTVILGVASLLLVFIYPLMKRVTWWPQLFLGFTFNWGALMGWTAVTGSLAWPAALLYAAGIFWTLGYDTIYAYQDAQDDALVGIKSTARLFGDRPRRWVAGFYVLAIGLLGVAGSLAQENYAFYILTALAGCSALRQIATWNPADPANCLQRFRDNRDFGLIVFIAICLGRWF